MPLSLTKSLEQTNKQKADVSAWNFVWWYEWVVNTLTDFSIQHIAELLDNKITEPYLSICLELLKHFTAVSSPLATSSCSGSRSYCSHQKFCNKLQTLTMFYYKIRRFSLNYYIPIHVMRWRDCDTLRLAKLISVSP